MAEEWIRMRHALQTDPKVAAIGKWLVAHAPFRSAITRDASCDVTVTSLSRHAVRYIVTGALHAVWCAADEHADGGVITGADLGWIDEVTDLPGFGQAMESVSWAEVIPDGLRFPKFATNNTSGAERTRKYRERQKALAALARDAACDVTCDAHVTDREEKSREQENKDNAAEPPSVSSKGSRKRQYDAAFAEWYAIYPRKVGKDAAATAFANAVRKIVDDVSLPPTTEPEAIAWLCERTREFSTTPKAQGDYCPYPATWLNEGRYEDDQATWQGHVAQPAPEYATLAPPTSRRSAAL